ncbi:AAA family ATPase [Isoptericola jiangsuensis]|uniref:AAA family ATPase n=1 Tax=Isoptericola jiangsuensis TaxID=548579 RepID=UPI003AAF47DC
MSTEPQSTELLHVWHVPVVGGGSMDLPAVAGGVTTIVGANGAGKSALATNLHQQAPAETTRRLIAHRKLWFTHSGPEISSAQREQTSQNAQNFDRRPDSRYTDRYADSRTSIALFDLVGKVSDQHRQIVEAQDGGASWEEAQAAVGERLLTSLNRILEGAGLFVSVEITERQTFNARHRDVGVVYPIFQMSDGEKSALLLAAEVLTAPAGGILIIDEPERHLHRSISARLIESVVAARSDCAFIILTHDLDLAAALGDYGSTYAAIGVKWSGDRAAAWDVLEVSAGEQLPESARRAILGGRKRILFIEGDHGSVDLRLYRILYSDWSPVPAGGCNEVIRAVKGLRSSSQHHWLTAVGLVDGDGRETAERDRLRESGILPLPISEVENFYYLPEVLEAVAGRQSMTLGEDPGQLVEVAVENALGELGSAGTLERLAGNLARDAVTRQFVDYLPSEVGEEDVTVTFPSPYVSIFARVKRLHEDGDYAGLIRELPIRNTGVRAKVAKALGFASIAHYENAARTAIGSDEALRSVARAGIGALPE